MADFYDPNDPQAQTTASSDPTSQQQFLSPDDMSASDTASQTDQTTTQSSTSSGNFTDDTTMQADSPDGASTDTTTPPPDQQPPPGQGTEPTQPPLEGYQQGMSAADYNTWYQSMTAAGYTAQQILQYKQSVLQGGSGRGNGSGQNAGGFPGNLDPYGDSTGGYVGGNMGSADTLADWEPGMTYTGQGEPPMPGTGETFTPELGEDEGPQAVNWDVTSEQTVQGQMDQLTQNMSSNPVFQSLAASLERAQAAHGGENSLMAETAAYNGVVSMAFNIASQDAATYARSAEFNASTANQFALSNRQFMQQALLSTQNYQQAQVLQQQQIQGNLQSVGMQIAGQLRSTEIGANAQIASATIGARAQVQSATIGAGAAIHSAEIQRQTALDSIQANFEGNWALNEQQQGHALELNDRQTDNSIRHDIVQGNQQFGQQLTLQMNADNSANLRQLMAGVTSIGSTPGLTGEQQAHAVQQLTDMYHTNANLGSSFYSSGSYSLSTGAAGAAVTGNGGNPSVAAAMATTPGGPSYQMYGDYLSYGHGGYTMTAPPTLPFYGGSGLVTTQGGIPFYGSNLDYENNTGNEVNYNNELTGNNPIGNAPGQVTGGANYTGNDFMPVPPTTTTP